MDQVSEIREKIDLPSLISEYIPLKKAGSNFKGLCPFHQEKTPSFVVSPERQIWHCFGCGKGGDAFSFLMEYENMDFPEALRTLAKKTGVKLQGYDFQKGAFSQKEKIYKINSISAKFYNFVLTKHKIGKVALDYLTKKRGLNIKLINNYFLGFSTSDNSLSKYLTAKKDYKEGDLIEAGLSYIRDGKILDFFKGRIMFPLTDHRGNIVGFSGRSLSDDAQSKYINTKDTLVYHKGSLFFGLDTARDEIKKKENAIIVEGEFDVLAAFKNGIKNIVAIKGTALTENQANLLSRFTKKVTLCLDQDEAGFTATKRSLASLEKNGMSIDIVTLKEKDPDEQLKKNPTAFKKALKQAQSIYDFLISKTMSKESSKNADAKRNITEELLPIFSQIENEVVKEHYIRTLANKINTSFESILKEIDKIKIQKEKQEITFVQKDKKGRREILEEFLLSFFLQSENPKEFLEDEKEFLGKYKFDNLAITRIFKYAKEYFEKNKKWDIKKFSIKIPAELLAILDLCFLFPIPKFKNKEIAERYLLKIKNELSFLQTKSEKISQITAVS